MIRILVVDDHTLVRVGLCRLLDAEQNIEVVGETGKCAEAVRMVKELKPDLVLLDYGLPDMDGLETTRQITELRVKTKVLILTMHANEDYAIRSIQSGASGFIVKGASPAELVSAVRKVAAGGSYVTETIMDQMVGRIGQPKHEKPESALSNRELQVLVRLARGFSSKEVSQQLNLSVSTVETYRSRLLDKLNCRNNSDLTRFALRRGLIDMME